MGRRTQALPGDDRMFHMGKDLIRFYGRPNGSFEPFTAFTLIPEIGAASASDLQRRARFPAL